MDDEKDLTKTRALTELEPLQEEAKKEVEKKEIEVENPEFVDSEEVTKEFTIEEKDKKKKENIIDKFKKLPKKTKIIIIVSSVIVLLLIIGLILFLVLRKPKEEDDTPKEEVIVNESTYTYKNGTLIIYDSAKNTLGEYECTNKDEELCYVAYYENNLDDFNTMEIYKEDEILLDRSTNYGDLIFIYDNPEAKDGEITLYNLKDKEEVAKYKNIKKVNEELAIVNDDNYKLVSLKDNKVTTIAEDYTYMAYEDDFKSDRVVGSKDDKYYLLDFNGKVLTSKLDSNVVMYSNSYIVLRNSDAYKVVDYQNKAILEDAEYALLYDKFIVSIEDQKLYLKSYEGFNYNLDGVKLSTRSYKPTKKYDKDNNLVSEEEAFNLEVNGNTIVVHKEDGDKTIDLLEGENSKAKNYYSYYDGKLYFYSDEEKKELIGTYPCENKNTSTNSDGIFSTCDVAIQSNFSNNYKTSDTSFGLVPIYYNRFVFVSDNSNLTSEDSKVIYLYDLKNKRKLGSYSEVDAGTKENFGNVNVDTNILAKNKDGKFGMITLESSGVSATYRSDYNFKVTKMERFGKDVIVLKDGKWEVLSSDGTSKGGFNGKILDYLDKYYLIEDNGKVRVYNLEGLKDIGKDGYDYVKLTTSFYVYVNNGNLGVKNYEGSSLLLDDEEVTIPVAVTDYNKNLRISIVGSKGTITILNGNGETLETHTFSTKVNTWEPDKPVDDTEENDAD